MLVAFKDEQVQRLYERAKDPFWESREMVILPPLRRPPLSTPKKEVVSAVVLE
jgi:hypothetical protein